MNPEIKISACIITYNQIEYIRECIEGAIMQTFSPNIDFEIIIGDDCSTDETGSICKEYQDKYPGLIKYHRSDKNSGMIGNWQETIKRCEGKYIALCEGDDYWTDPLKLQKQVDFMEANPDFSICFHRANLLKEDATFSLHPIPETSKIGKFIYADLLRDYNFITTASVLFRKPTNFDFPGWFTKVPFGDLALYQFISKGSFIKCLDEIMSVYRIHEGGVYSKLTSIKKSEQYLLFYSIIFPELNDEEQEIVKKKWNKQLKQISKIKYPNQKGLSFIFRKYLTIKYSLE